MGMSVNNNIAAMNSYRNLSVTDSQMGKSLEKLSSGFRINRAADDAAGLAISEKMRGQIGGLAQSQRNAQDGISLVQTAEGALTEVHSMLQRVRELKVQYDNGTLSTEDKAAIDAEFTQLKTEIAAIRDDTAFNKNDLLNSAGTTTFQVGANASETISVTRIDLTGASGTGNASGVSVAGSLSAVSIDSIDKGIENVSKLRGDFGAVQNRLEHRIANLATYQENLVAAESRIRDVDMASEMVNFSKLSILQQAGTSMLAQANQSPQSVLSLLR